MPHPVIKLFPAQQTRACELCMARAYVLVPRLNGTVDDTLMAPLCKQCFEEWKVVHEHSVLPLPADERQ